METKKSSSSQIVNVLLPPPVSKDENKTNNDDNWQIKKQHAIACIYETRTIKQVLPKNQVDSTLTPDIKKDLKIRRFTKAVFSLDNKLMLVYIAVIIITARMTLFSSAES
ncbi:hypothetical protein KUTeg_004146 [Tegillarca granosa]|uniref:Uncharacterized protein n=1 Tax=Tegillarca granosa TaxID=220873 RepID=A0ABQ9FP75_TEGGR|nr:hypothetical protein KUTeg_004146 [Tegillarca granosa]